MAEEGRRCELEMTKEGRRARTLLRLILPARAQDHALAGDAARQNSRRRARSVVVRVDPPPPRSPSSPAGSRRGFAASPLLRRRGWPATEPHSDPCRRRAHGPAARFDVSGGRPDDAGAAARPRRR
ncbi:unnamed protein product [Urochloa humidicola]